MARPLFLSKKFLALVLFVILTSSAIYWLRHNATTKRHIVDNYTSPHLSLTDQALVVVGATSCYGYHLIQSLHQHSAIVVPLEESFINLLYNNDVWNTWDSYASQDLKPNWIDFSDNEKVKGIFKSHRPSAVVYTSVYSVLDIYSIERTDFTEKVATTLKSFVSLLEIIRTNHSKVTVILPLIELSSPIRRAWLKQFEVTLVTYQTLYDLNVALLRVNARPGTGYKLKRGSDGDCKSIEQHIPQLIQLTTTNHSDIFELASCNEDATFSYSTFCTGHTEVPSSETKDIVFTTYFTSKGDPQRGRRQPTNNFRYMKKWFVGAMQHRLNVVVFYDKMDAEWIRRAEAAYPRAKFVASDLKRRSTNDARYFILRDYLESHPEVRRAFLTDVSDIQVWGDPFKLMDVLGNELLYMGQDTTFYTYASEHGWVEAVINICYGKSIHKKEEESLHKAYTLYNAGITGGDRHALLTMLKWLLHWLDAANHAYNCNMAAINIITHKYFFEQIFTGYPLQSGFKVSIAGPFGLMFKHK